MVCFNSRIFGIRNQKTQKTEVTVSHWSFSAESHTGAGAPVFGGQTAGPTRCSWSHCGGGGPISTHFSCKLRTKRIRFKMGQKAAATTRNIYSAFGPGTADEHTVQWGFKKICTGDESLGGEGVVAGHQKLTVSN